MLETIRLFVMKAQTHKAIEELYQFCNQHNISEWRDQIVLLSSSLNEVKNSELLGLGQFIQEKNRINLALLDIIQKLDEQIQNQETIISTTVSQDEQLSLIETKVDFLLRHIEKNDDLVFYSFQNSRLWNHLEADSQKNLTTANIIEKEGKQDQYADAILLYLESAHLELETKLFDRFRDAMREKKLERESFINDLHGDNKGALYKYLEGGPGLSLNQISEVLLSNIFQVDKQELKGAGKDFYSAFFDSFKMKYDKKVIEFFEIYRRLKTKNIRTFTQTLIDVIQTKENVISLFLNLQPRSFAKNKEALSGSESKT